MEEKRGPYFGISPCLSPLADLCKGGGLRSDKRASSWSLADAIVFRSWVCEPYFWGHQHDLKGLLFFRTFHCLLGLWEDRDLCPLGSWLLGKSSPPAVRAGECGQTWAPAFLPRNAKFSGSVPISFSPSGEAQAFSFLFFFFLQGPGQQSSPSCSPPVRVSDISPETLIWKLFEPVKNHLRGLSFPWAKGILCVMEWKDLNGTITSRITGYLPVLAHSASLLCFAECGYNGFCLNKKSCVTDAFAKPWSLSSYFSKNVL